MKILMLNYEFPPIGGGAANANLCLLKEFAKLNNITVDLLTSTTNPGLLKENFADNITIHKIGIHKKKLHYWRKIEVIEWLIKARIYFQKLLNAHNFDLMHAFFAFPTGWVCYKSAKKIPFIISLRGSDVPGQNLRLKYDYKILAPLFRAIWNNANALIACSNGLKNRALKFLPNASIDIIPNGVDLDKFSPAKSKQKNDTLNLLTVGRLSSTKRVDLLINTIEILKNQNLNIHFNIVGDGALLNPLKQIVTEKKLTTDIEFLGRIDSDNMPQIYQNSHIYISATMQEGMSNAMLEAMASALPIVTTSCEGLDELITDNGIIVQNENPKALADAIINLMQNKNKYDNMSIAARKQAEKFSWKNVAEKYIQSYYKLLKEK